MSKIQYCVMHWQSIMTYMALSVIIVFSNNTVVNIYGFKNIAFFLLCQSVCTVFLMLIYPKFRKKIQKPSMEILSSCLLNVANVFFGVSAASELNIAMFSSLRRFSILFTLIAQYRFLDVKPTKPVIYSVVLMILGSFIAAGNDMTFNLAGYILVMIANILTTSSQIVTQKALVVYCKTSILFWSAVVATILFGITCQNPSKFQYWGNGGFRLAFCLSLCLGFLINYYATMTIEKNSALTLAVAGSFKDAICGIGVGFVTTYDFSWMNFTGLQISAISSMFYVIAMEQQKKQQKKIIGILG